MAELEISRRMAEWINQARRGGVPVAVRQRPTSVLIIMRDPAEQTGWLKIQQYRSSHGRMCHEALAKTNILYESKVIPLRAVGEKIGQYVAAVERLK